MSLGDIILIRTLVANCYLVLDEPPFLVDTNSTKYLGVLEKAIADEGVDIKDLGCIILTHFHYDHTGNAAELARLSGAQVWAPAAEAAIISGEAGMPLPRRPSTTGRLVSRLPRKVLKKYLAFAPVPVARELHEGNGLPLLGGLEVLDLPGHTVGGIGLLQPERKLVFTGDIVGSARGKPGLPIMAFSEDKGAILDSMRRLVGLGVDYIFPGHGSVIGPGAADILAGFLAGEKSRAD